MLREEDKKQIQAQLKDMKDPVRFVFFTQQMAGTCQYCIETETLLKELVEISELLSLKILNYITDKDDVKSLSIDKIPATAVQADKDAGIRFYGIPTGYEFAAFLQMILALSQGNSGLDDILKERLHQIQNPVHIQTFVTPTCPYCTRSAFTSYQFAMENSNIRADVVEISEFPHLAQKYGVMGVPKVVINESHSFEGALPETMFLEHIEIALKKE
ncbi:thioredoxin family protein [bacterium]|nr:thioredoxin family protein [bacterium]